MRKLGVVGTIGLIGVVIGAINWGLVGLFDYNLVEEIFGVGSTATDVVYVIVGALGIVSLAALVYALRLVSRGGAESATALITAVSLIIAVIGAINWGLVGLFDYNLVEEIFGVGSTATDVVYVIVGVAGVITLLSLLGLFGLEAGRRRDTRPLEEDVDYRDRRAA
jgi:uncharacterized membrane protein YuzA (DUF378 family)